MTNLSFWGIYNLNNNQYSFVRMKNLNNDIFGSFMYFHPKEVNFISQIPKLFLDKVLKAHP
jgi:hypothetical protein